MPSPAHSAALGDGCTGLSLLRSLVKPLQTTRATKGEFLAFVVAYLQFLLAVWQARERGLEATNNPIATDHLLSQGIGDGVLLWMLYQAHVAALGPASGPMGDCFGHCPVESTRIRQIRFLALTEVGEAFAEQFLVQVMFPSSEWDFEEARDLLPVGRLAPRYDSFPCFFSWGCHVLKHFRQPSLN